MIRFTLPGLPPSYNHAHFAKGRVLKPETRRWIEHAGLILLGQKRGQDQLEEGGLALYIRLYGKWTTKAGTLRRVDLSNRIKILEDVVAEVCQFDDSAVTLIRAEKVSGEERTEVDVYHRDEMP